MGDRLKIGDLLLDPGRARVTRGGSPLALPDLSFRVLYCLARHAPGPVSRETLAREAWGLTHVSEETLAQRIALLRRELSDDPRDPRYVRTVRGEGYALAAPVRPAGTPPLLLAFASLAAAGLLVAGGWVLLGGESIEDIDSAGATEASRLIERAREQLAVQQPAETDRAIQLFEAALAAEPGSLEARTGVSFALSARVTKFVPTASDANRAEALARGVIADDPDYAPAWHALGYALDSQGRVAEALSAYEQSLVLDPGETAARSSAAYLMIVSGRLHAGLRLELEGLSDGRSSRYAESQIALALDLLGLAAADAWYARARTANPGQLVVAAAEAEAALRRGDAAAALERIHTLPEPVRALPRAQRIRARALLQSGDRETARTAFTAAGDQGGLDLAALDAAGRPDAARAALDDIHAAMRAGDSWPELPVRAAEIHAELGETREALDMLSRAVDRGYRDTGALHHSPFLAPLADDPAWAAILDRIGRAVEAERRLVEADPDLAPLLEP